MSLNKWMTMNGPRLWGVLLFLHFLQFQLVQPTFAEVNIVVIGGGGGASQTMKALGRMGKFDRLTGVINNADDGGSTGRMLTEYADLQIAWGDTGKCAMKLANDEDSTVADLVRILDHRFVGGHLDGDTVRNVFFAAAEKVLTDKNELFDFMGRLLQFPKGAELLPLNLRHGHAIYRKREGGVVDGQAEIANFPFQDVEPNPMQIELQYSNLNAKDINPKVVDRIQKATHIIVAPGNVYATILLALATPGLKEIIANSKAKLILAVPLFNRVTAKQTNGWTVATHVDVYQKYLGRAPDVVLANTHDPGPIEEYELVKLDQGKEKVKDKEKRKYQLVATPLMEEKRAEYAESDAIKRSPVTHDPERLGEALSKILSGE